MAYSEETKEEKKIPRAAYTKRNQIKQGGTPSARGDALRYSRKEPPATFRA